MKKFLGLLVLSLMGLTASSCSMAYGDRSSVTPVVTADEADSNSVLETLRWAEEIQLKKAAVSLNDVYGVSADGVKVGEIRGQYIYALGDTYSFFSENGNLVSSEGEGYRLITAKAELFDYYNEPSGSIEQNISWPLATWSLLDTEGELIGQGNQNLSLTLDFTVNDSEGNPEYRIKKNLFSLLGAELTIERIANEPTVPVLHALWLAAITNEIAEAEDEKNSNS